jgi:hypothetical protein
VPVLNVCVGDVIFMENKFNTIDSISLETPDYTTDDNWRVSLWFYKIDGHKVLAGDELVTRVWRHISSCHKDMNLTSF